jgi:hypothetical protein
VDRFGVRADAFLGPKGQPSIAQGNALGIGANYDAQAPKGRNSKGRSMPQSLANVLIHIVFSTKNRQPLLKAESLFSPSQAAGLGYRS